MMMSSSVPHLSPRRLRRRKSIWPLTPRQRIAIYMVLGAMVGLACGGVNYTIDANLMDCVFPTTSGFECETALKQRQCETVTFANGSCQLGRCKQPCSGSKANNCPFGKNNGGIPWTSADCRNQIQLAGCTNGTLYSYGCYGYNCSDQRCGRQ